MGKYIERVFKKILLKPNSASHNNASRYTNTDGYLEYAPSGGRLYCKGPTVQKIILFGGGSPLVYKWNRIDSPEINPHLYSQYLIEEASTYNGVKLVYLINGLGKTGQMSTENSRPPSYPFDHINRSSQICSPDAQLLLLEIIYVVPSGFFFAFFL